MTLPLLRRPPADPNPRPAQVTAYWARHVWLAIVGAGAAFEVYGAFVRRGGDDTLSELTRWVFRTHGRRGAVTFVTAWVAFATWFPIHILKLWRQAKSA